MKTLQRIGIILVLSALLAGLALRFLGTPEIWYGVLDRAPGSERHDLEGLDPDFRARVELLLLKLAAQGYPSYVRAGLRDQARQDHWVALGYSNTRNSKHLDGLAVDLLFSESFIAYPTHIEYFHRLRKEAKILGLCSGGDWEQKDPIWALFDLGWDPAHVEVCSR